MKINELRDGMRKVDVEGNVVEKTDAREVRSRYTNETYKVADATLEDETGKITLTTELESRTVTSNLLEMCSSLTQENTGH